MRLKLFKPRDLLALLAICLIGFLLPFIWGRKGFIVFDFSLIVDGGWRIINGELPHINYIMPSGPAIFYVQALFYLIFGANLYSILLHTSIFNALASGVGFYVVRTQSSFIYASVAGLLTSVWFYLPFSFPWFDTLAFFFVLLAFVIYELSLYRNPKSKGVYPFLIGVLLAFAFFSKQNIGGFAIVIFALLLLFRVGFRGWKQILLYLLGFLSVFACYATFIWTQGAWERFVDSFFVRPALLGRVGRLFDFSRWFNFIFRWPQIMLVISLAIITCHGFILRHKRKVHNFIDLVALLILSELAAFTGDASKWMFFPYIGIVLCLYLYRYLGTAPSQAKKAMSRQKEKTLSLKTTISYLILFALFLFLFIQGLEVGTSRRVGSYCFARQGYDFSYDLKTLKFRPFKMDRQFGPELDLIVERAKALIKPEEKVFIFPNAYLLYMALDKVSPQVFSWFHPGHSLFNQLGDDKRLVQSLQDTKPEWMIFDKKNQIHEPHSVRGMFAYLPKLLTFVEENYFLFGETDGYLILRLKEEQTQKR